MCIRCMGVYNVYGCVYGIWMCISCKGVYEMYGRVYVIWVCMGVYVHVVFMRCMSVYKVYVYA